MAESRALTTGQKINNIRDLMVANTDKMFAALPKHITADKMIRIACSSLVRTPKLLECTQTSLLNAITEAAALGLVPDGVLGHAYLVPFKETCTLIPGYKGLVALCRQSGEISSFYAHVVRSDDEFKYTLGTDKRITHNPGNGEHDGTYTHVYAVAHYHNGGYDFEVMSHAEVEKHKKQYSKNYTKKDSAWNTAPESMARKTVIRRLITLLPVSSEIQRYAALGDQHEANIVDGQVGNKRVTRAELPDFSETGEPDPEPTSAAEQFEEENPPGKAGDLFDGQAGEQP